ncbi:MAG: SGNH/GDSL hydrolase family protein [Planctomycetota bacterium]|nr:SGNH/GDSL hydrolase family protein [Planctomycetota bacterium]
MSETQVVNRARPWWRTLSIVLGIVLGLLVLVLEIGSRVCDGIIESRKQDKEQREEMMKRLHEPDLIEKLSYGVLEYGTMLRADQLKKARTEPHPYLGYVLSPNFSTPEGADQQARHNSMGFRGKETTWEKPPGVFRIVTTGGSSVYGQSESCDAAVWSQKLEDYLNAGGGGRKFEVVNVGVPGWSSFEMLINLELRALDLQPDLVIVYEAINDMRCALYTPGGEPQRDNTHWRATWFTDRPSRIDELLAHSRTYLIWRRYMTDYVQARSDLFFFGVKNFANNNDDAYVHTAAGKPLPEMGFTTYRRNLNNIISLVKQSGAQVLIVTQAFPRWHLNDAKNSIPDQLTAFGRIQNIQRELANERGIPLFECAEIVEKAIENELYAERDRQKASKPELDDAAAEAEARKIVGKGRRAGLFFSEVHPNDSGSNLIGKLVSEYLLGTLLAK